MKSLKEYVKEEVHFVYFFNDCLWYSTEDEFIFPVPINELDGATVHKIEKGMTLMKWLRRQMMLVDQALKETEFKIETD